MTLIKKVKKLRFLLIFLSPLLAILLLYIITFEPEEPKFSLNIKGINNKELIINIEMFGYDSSKEEIKIQSLAYKGKNFDVTPKYSHYYCIYVSYQEKYFSSCFDNIFYPLRGDKDRINHITIISYNNEVKVNYSGLKNNFRSIPQENQNIKIKSENGNEYLNFYP